MWVYCPFSIEEEYVGIKIIPDKTDLKKVQEIHFIKCHACLHHEVCILFI